MQFTLSFGLLFSYSHQTSDCAIVFLSSASHDLALAHKSCQFCENPEDPVFCPSSYVRIFTQAHLFRLMMLNWGIPIMGGAGN